MSNPIEIKLQTLAKNITLFRKWIVAIDDNSVTFDIPRGSFTDEEYSLITKQAVEVDPLPEDFDRIGFSKDCLYIKSKTLTFEGKKYFGRFEEQKPKLLISFYDVVKQCDSIVKQLKQKPRRIVGLQRGGLTPAVILSHILDIPMYALPISSYTSYNRTSVTCENPRLENFDLVIDDLIDSGETIKYLQNNNTTKLVTYATLYTKDAELSERLKCLYGRVLSSSKWVVFPWEE